MEDIDTLLDNYELGRPEYKPDVKRQLAEIKIDRENKIQEIMKQQADYQEVMNKITMMTNPEVIHQKKNEQTMMIQQLLNENNQLKEQVEYLNNKIKQLILSQIENRKEEKRYS